ncbi:hypothetical protein CORC01_09085 [Colletotrichum orchidophilum]|uniref:Uncharacterized protein n=1 Tax=Colletotrichum orchidophilum TaxID=1209926 RepID=A0A1G4B2U0_9PEZI|nr:uncharacterized protein CORC01_09085 [Colletotrichum orchidophilum]OHE95653.1 hypothetical protein CORC01_09085 [Colletotrichum orchidophilum]
MCVYRRLFVLVRERRTRKIFVGAPRIAGTALVRWVVADQRPSTGNSDLWSGRRVRLRVSKQQDIETRVGERAHCADTFHEATRGPEQEGRGRHTQRTEDVKERETLELIRHFISLYASNASTGTSYRVPGFCSDASLVARVMAYHPFS